MPTLNPEELLISNKIVDLIDQLNDEMDAADKMGLKVNIIPIKRNFQGRPDVRQIYCNVNVEIATSENVIQEAVKKHERSRLSRNRG